MTVEEIIASYREQQRTRLATAWENLRETTFPGGGEVRNFDPFLWSLDHQKVTVPIAQRAPRIAWCHRECAGRWMFNELPNGDMYLFELPADATRFRSFQPEAG
jgi:hypothetical protein